MKGFGVYSGVRISSSWSCLKYGACENLIPLFFAFTVRYIVILFTEMGEDK